MKPIFVGLLRGVANERIDPLVTLAEIFVKRVDERENGGLR